MENGQNDDYCILRCFDGYQGEKLRNVNIRESNNCFCQLRNQSLITREMQITQPKWDVTSQLLRCCYQQLRANQCWRRYREKETLVHLWWDCKFVLSQWKTGWKYFRKLKTEVPFDLEIPLLGVYSKKMKQDLREIYAPMFTTAYSQ